MRPSLVSTETNATGNENPYGLHDPPLNSTNWQGSSGSHYWTITSAGYYPIDWFNYASDFVGGILTTSNPFAINIQASNVVLDGMGLTLSGIGTNTGILVNGGSSNVQVTNFTITGMLDGVFFNGVTYDGSITAGGDLATGGQAAPVPNVISDINAIGNSVGIHLLNSENVTLENNNATENEHAGYDVYYSDHNTFTGNNATDNGWEGFYLWNSSSNTFTDNNGTGNTHGFYLDHYSSSNTLSDNNASDNDYNGFHLRDHSILNILTNNNATDNSGLTTEGAGFTVSDNSDSNTLTGNFAGGSTWYGFHVTEQRKCHVEKQ